MKKLICLLCIALVLCVTGCNKDTEGEETTTKEELKTNDIYEVPSDPTDYQITLYNELTESVTKEKVSEDAAVLVAENFVADFFTLKNKDDAEDIGGLTYIPETQRDNFKEYASYVYANIETITEDYGKKHLPIVKEITVDKENIEKKEISYNNIVVDEDKNESVVEGTYDAYIIPVTIAYKDTKAENLLEACTVTVIDLDGRLCVISLSNNSSTETE